MPSQWWSDDDQLLAALEDALREARDVPRHFIDAGKAVYAWHNIDAELAALTYDSAAESRRPVAATRAERAALRELTLATRQLKIHIQVTDRALHGQIVPAQQAEIELRTVDRPPEVIPTDTDGWFSVQPIPIGSFRLHCRTATGITALTDWLAI
jgi:hypothetical protein